MKKVHQILLFCILVLVATACSTGNLAFQHGDYFKACQESIDRLRSNPKNSKSQNVLTKAYPMAQSTALREIENARLANGPDQFEVQVYQYEKLNQLANDIFKCPKANELIPQPAQYIEELSKARQMAAEQAYESGMKALGFGTLDQAREAYQYFQNANKFVSSYKDVQQKILIARNMATIRVVVQKPYLNDNFDYSADFFYTDLMNGLRQNAQNRFIRYYTPEEAHRENLQNPHQSIVLNFENFSIGDLNETSNTKELTRDSVVVGEVKVDGKSYNSYNTVKAKLTIIQREITSGGLLSIRIIDAQNKQELQRKDINGTYTWETRWGKYKGDDRAMTEKQKELCTKEPDIPPSEQQLFVEYTKPLYTQAFSYIQSVYSRY